MHRQTVLLLILYRVHAIATSCFIDIAVYIIREIATLCSSLILIKINIYEPVPRLGFCKQQHVASASIQDQIKTLRQPRHIDDLFLQVLYIARESPILVALTGLCKIHAHTLSNTWGHMMRVRLFKE
jgi:hypothetical protein